VTQERWQELTGWPLTVAAAVFLVAYAWEVLGRLDGAAAGVADTVINVTWLLFLGDYITNLVLAERRGHWFVTHLFDFVVVALPVLRPLRLLRLVTLVSILQRRASSAFRGRVVLFAASTTALLLFVASLAVLDAERGAVGASITTFPQALWWSFVTITTVGYGDLFPVTGAGRLIAAGVMLSADTTARPRTDGGDPTPAGGVPRPTRCHSSSARRWDGGRRRSAGVTGRAVLRSW
jgi:voltage-gated potassium channel